MMTLVMKKKFPFPEPLPCGRHRAKCFLYVTSWHPHSSSLRISQKIGEFDSVVRLTQEPAAKEDLDLGSGNANLGFAGHVMLGRFGYLEASVSLPVKWG